MSDQNLATILITLLQPNQDGLVHVQILHATMPSASTYMQLNIIVVKALHLSLLNQAVRQNTISPITNKQSMILLNPEIFFLTKVKRITVTPLVVSSSRACICITNNHRFSNIARTIFSNYNSKSLFMNRRNELSISEIMTTMIFSTGQRDYVKKRSLEEITDIKDSNRYL